MRINAVSPLSPWERAGVRALAAYSALTRFPKTCCASLRKPPLPKGEGEGKRTLAALAALLLFPLPAHAAPLNIVASFSILGDMTQQIAGDDAHVKSIVGPDSDAHAYEPSPADAKALAAADLVIVNGLGFESWLGRLISSSGYAKPVITATSGIAPLTFAGTNHEDPHAWQDLANGRIYAANIRDALIAADPAHAAAYRANATSYIAKIDALNASTRSELAAIPEAKRQIISTHDAFGYFARAYGVAFIAPPGLNPESSVSAADVAHLIDLIRARHVRVLFLENIADPRLIRQLQADTGATIGGTLYSDALSPPEGPAGTYLALFAYNVRQLVDGMKGNQ